MAGVNAFRSRGDAEKVKLGCERKFADGGSHGPARIGYLNVREKIEGREVAAIATDPERILFIRLAFDLAATGGHTITTITETLEEAGLRTRGTHKRPSQPLSRSMVHRILRDDYYIGVVTRNGVKREGAMTRSSTGRPSSKSRSSSTPTAPAATAPTSTPTTSRAPCSAGSAASASDTDATATAPASTTSTTPASAASPRPGAAKRPTSAYT